MPKDVAEDIITSPRSWRPPTMAHSADLLMTKTFRGDRPDRQKTGVLGFGGTVKRHVMSREEVDALKAFFADRFMRLQDNGCRQIVTGKKFNHSNAIGLTRAFDPSMSQIRTVTCQELLEYIHHADLNTENLGSGQVGKRRVELLAACFEWKELQQLNLQDVTRAIEDYFDSHQEVLVGQPMLEGHTAVIMTGAERCALTPELLLANHKLKEVESWRNAKRSEAKAKQHEITQLQERIEKETAIIEELMVSPKAWTRKGQTEIAEMKRATKLVEQLRSEKQQELAAIQSDAELDVRSVLESMWETSPEEEKSGYIQEFECLSEKYIRPMEGLRVRFSTLWLKKMRKLGHKDTSVAPGSCDAMPPAATRWFGNVTFLDGNFPDIPAGTLAHEGGLGTIKFVHRDGDRVMVQWDRSGKTDWYSTGFLCNFALALCDQDEGVGTTGCGEGLSSMRLLSSRLDCTPSMAAERVELRRKKHMGKGTELPAYDIEGEKHIGKKYDRLTGTGYL